MTIGRGLTALSAALLLGVPAGVAAPSDAAYRGYVYSLPAERPFISLDDFASADRRSNAYLRLKAQVDSAVSVTARLPAGATYGQLVSALNPAHYGYSATDSVIMYRLSRDPKYIEQAVRMVDLFVTSENSRIASGAAPAIAGDSYLEVGHFMEQLALTYDYGYARLSAAQRSAWETYAQQTLYNLWNHESAQWGGVKRPWTGWAVNDPGNNYFYSFLKATQLWALARQDMGWIRFLQTRKYTILTPFFGALAGGGSREGTGYGTSMGSLFESYAYWKASTGEDLASYSSHARDTIDYWIHATVPTFDYYAAIGDQSRSSMPLMFDYQRKLMKEAVSLYPGTEQARRGLWWLNRIKVTDGGGGTVTGRMRYNYNFRYDLLATSGIEEEPTSSLYDASGTGAIFARSDWTTSASWFQANAGVYDQSHAHQDQGSFSFFKGSWLTLTSNVYSRSGINQGVDAQNVIRFTSGGKAIPQRESVSSRTVSDDGNAVRIDANLSPAYTASGGQVAGWFRTFVYRRATHDIKVRDRCEIAGGVTPIWQLHLPVAPRRQADGSYLAGNLRIIPVSPAIHSVVVTEMRSLSADYRDGYRFELTGAAGKCEFEVDLRVR